MYFYRLVRLYVLFFYAITERFGKSSSMDFVDIFGFYNLIEKTKFNSPNKCFVWRLILSSLRIKQLPPSKIPFSSSAKLYSVTTSSGPGPGRYFFVKKEVYKKKSKVKKRYSGLRRITDTVSDLSVLPISLLLLNAIQKILYRINHYLRTTFNRYVCSQYTYSTCSWNKSTLCP